MPHTNVSPPSEEEEFPRHPLVVPLCALPCYLAEYAPTEPSLPVKVYPGQFSGVGHRVKVGLWPGQSEQGPPELELNGARAGCPLVIHRKSSSTAPYRLLAAMSTKG